MSPGHRKQEHGDSDNTFLLKFFSTMMKPVCYNVCPTTFSIFRIYGAELELKNALSAPGSPDLTNVNEIRVTAPSAKCDET